MAAAKLGKTRPERAGSLPQKISEFDLLTSKTTVYDSISATAEAIGIKQSQISIYFIRNQKKPSKNNIYFKKYNIIFYSSLSS